MAATLLAATGAALALATPAADAAKPCWERVLDDWVDNGRIDGVYSAGCLEAARKHVLKRWMFRPAMQDGVAVQAIGLVPINFSLAH